MVCNLWLASGGLLFVVCGSWRVVNCCWFVVGRLLVVCGWLFAGCMFFANLLFVVGCWCLVVDGLLFAVCCLLFAVDVLRMVVFGLWFVCCVWLPIRGFPTSIFYNY